MKQSFTKLAAIAALLSCGAAAQAQPLTYVANGALDPKSFTNGAFDITGPATGTGQEYASGYAGSSAVVDAMLTRPNAASQDALAPLTNITVQFGYDASAPALSTSTNATRSFSIYSADDIRATLSGVGAGTVNLLVTDASIAVVTRATSTSLNVYGNLASAGVGFGDATPALQLVDLAAAIRSDPYSTFDLSAFSSLPVRLTSPQSFALVDLYGYAFGTRNNAAPFTSPLPNPLRLAEYDRYFAFEAAFAGQYAVSVNPADYASPAEYQAASAWVGSHVQQITYYAYTDYNIGALQVTSVPEPAGTLLLAVGLLAVIGKAAATATVRPARRA